MYFPTKSERYCLDYTAKNQYRKFETYIPRKGIARPQSQFLHSCVCERLVYSHDRSAYSAAGNMWTNPGNCSQTHECGNWDWGRAIPRKGNTEMGFSLQSIGRKKDTFLVGKENAYCSFWDDDCCFLPNECLLGSNDLSCPRHIRDLQPASPIKITVFLSL